MNIIAIFGFISAPLFHEASMTSLTSVKNNLFFILLILLYISATFPMGVAFVGLSLTKPLFAILALIAIFNYVKIRINDPMIWFLVCFVLYFLVIFSLTLFPHGYISSETIQRIIVNVTPLLICFVFIDYFKNSQNNNKITVLLFFAFLIIIVRSITAINAEILMPNIARNSATGMYDDFPEFGLIGAGTYQFINGLVFIVLPIMFILRHRGPVKVKILMMIVGILSLSAIVYTAWGTALIMYFLLILIGLSPQKTKYIPFYVALICAALLIAVNSDFVFQFLGSIFAGNPTIYDKIIDIKQSFLEGEASGQLESRQTLYIQSLDIFMSSPLFGDINAEPGGHAFWIDHLASFGILGTIPLILAYLSIIIKSAVFVPDDYRTYYYLNFFVFIIFGCLKNVGGYEFMLFLCVIGPLLLYASRGIKLAHKRQNLLKVICGGLRSEERLQKSI